MAVPTLEMYLATVRQVVCLAGWIQRRGDRGIGRSGRVSQSVGTDDGVVANDSGTLECGAAEMKNIESWLVIRDQ